MLKPAASAFNVALIVTTTMPIRPLFEFSTWWTITSFLFFAYALTTDLVFGRCFGMMLCGTRWKGNPTLWQKLIYNSSYGGAFFCLLPDQYVFIMIAASQIICVLSTGKTTHGLLARMESGPELELQSSMIAHEHLIHQVPTDETI